MEYKFTIFLENENHLNRFLEIYNRKNNTNFEIEDIIYDEVVFARLKTQNDSKEEILKLGIQYGKEVAMLLIK